MRLLRSGSRVPVTVGWLAAGAIGIAVLAAGVGYGVARFPASSVLDSLTRRAAAQSAPTPTTPAATRTAGPAVAGDPAAGAASTGNSRQPTGTVTQITPSPASFTLQAADGTLTTYSVLPTTVFMAGRDRPYRFDLLKTGDSVVVRGGAQIGQQGLGQGPGALASPQPIGVGNAAVGNPRVAGRVGTRGAAAQSNGEPIARIVVVRPANEAGRIRNGQNSAAQNGGSNGAGQ